MNKGDSYTAEKENELLSVQQIAHGNERAFAQLFNLYYTRLVYFTDRIISNRSEAEQIVSDSFAKLWKLRDNFKEKQLSDLRAFLYTVCYRAGLDFLRLGGGAMRKREVLTDDLENLLTPEEKVQAIPMFMDAEIYSRLYKEVDQLPEKEQLIIKLLLEDKSMGDIAAELGMQDAAVRQAKFKAVKKLREKLSRGLFLIIKINI